MAEQELKIKVVAEGVDQATSEIESLNDVVETNTECIEENTTAVEANEEASTVHTEAVKKNSLATIENALRNRELREIATGLGNTFVSLAQNMANASQITNDQQRQTAMLSAGWTAAKSAIMAVNPVIGAGVQAVDSLRVAVTTYIEAQERMRLNAEATAHLFSTRYNVDLTATKNVVHGLVSEMELQRIAIESQRNGLQLTSTLYRDIALAAQRLSQRTGEDLATSIRKVTDALAHGNAQALEDYGINVGNATSQTEVLTNATEALQQAQQVHNRTIEENRQNLIDQGASVEMVDEAIRNQTVASVSLDQHQRNALRHIREMNDEYNRTHEKLLEFEHDMDTASLATSRYYDSLMGVISARDQLNNITTHTGGLLGANAGESPEETVRRLNEEEKRRRENARSRGGGGGTAEQGTFERLTQGTHNISGLVNEEAGGFASTATDINAARDKQVEFERSFLDATTLVQAQLESSLETILQQNIHFDEQGNIINENNQEIILTNQQYEQSITYLNAQNEATKQLAITENERTVAAQNTADQLAKQAETTKAANMLQAKQAQEQNRYQQSMQGVNTLLNQGANIAATAHKDGKKAAKEQLKEWLKGFAISEALKGGASLAEGIGMTITNPPGAATKYIEAGKHFALAGAAGGAAGGLAAGGSSGGGGSSANNQPEAKPSNGTSSSTNNENNGPKSIVINVVGQTYLTEAQIGEGVSQAIQAYNTRY